MYFMHHYLSTVTIYLLGVQLRNKIKAILSDFLFRTIILE